jgi:hypothetical protein
LNWSSKMKQNKNRPMILTNFTFLNGYLFISIWYKSSPIFEDQKFFTYIYLLKPAILLTTMQFSVIYDTIDSKKAGSIMNERTNEQLRSKYWLIVTRCIYYSYMPYSILHRPIIYKDNQYRSYIYYLVKYWSILLLKTLGKCTLSYIILYPINIVHLFIVKNLFDFSSGVKVGQI